MIKNGEVAFTATPERHEFTTEWCDQSESGLETDFYYLSTRQADGERAWSSPIWVPRSR